TLTAKACSLARDAVADAPSVQRLAERCVTGTEKHVVVVAIQAMPLGVVGNDPGLGVVSHPAQGMLTQTHNPSQQQLNAGLERRLGENRLELIDDRCQRIYHDPQGGTSLPWGRDITLKERRNPLLLHPPVHPSSLVFCSRNSTTRGYHFAS